MTMKSLLSAALVALTLATGVAAAANPAHALDAKKFFDQQVGG
jgi:hypothetical protein